jgi:hypothetical protein
MKSFFLASLLTIVVVQQAEAIVGSPPNGGQIGAEQIYYYHGRYYPYHYHRGYYPYHRGYYPYRYHGYYYHHRAWRYGRWYYY